MYFSFQIIFYYFLIYYITSCPATLHCMSVFNLSWKKIAYFLIYYITSCPATLHCLNVGFYNSCEINWLSRAAFDTLWFLNCANYKVLKERGFKGKGERFYQRISLFFFSCFKENDFCVPFCIKLQLYQKII